MHADYDLCVYKFKVASLLDTFGCMVSCLPAWKIQDNWFLGGLVVLLLDSFLIAFLLG